MSLRCHVGQPSLDNHKETVVMDAGDTQSPSTPVSHEYFLTPSCNFANRTFIICRIFYGILLAMEIIS